MSQAVALRLPPPPWQALALWVLLPVSAVIVIVWMAFGFAALTLWPLVGLGVAVLLMGFVVAAVSHNRAWVERGELRLVAGLVFRRRVLLSSVDFDRIEILYEPRSVRDWLGLRVVGIGFPGFYAGWFRRDARWVFCQAVRQAPALRLPTSGRADVVIAVASPQDALAKLRNAADAG